MAIHVVRNSERLGVCSAEEIVEGLKTGRFAASDLAWREGMVAWTPLGEWNEFRLAAAMSSRVAPVPDLGAADTISPSAPWWEHGASLANYFKTVKEVALDPAETFANLRDGGYGRPIAFGYCSLLLPMICGGGLYFFISITRLVGEYGPAVFVGYYAGILSVYVCLAASLLLFPLTNLFASFVLRCLFLPWAQTAGYRQTYRTNAYLFGSFIPFILIPCLNYVAMPWFLASAIIAHSQVHRIAWWKVTVSLVVIACLCVCGVYALLFAAFLPRFAG